MKIDELNYDKVINELFTSRSVGEIGDKIDAFYSQSPLKGITFYFRIIVASHRHSFAKIDTYKNYYQRIQDYCSQKIQAIGNEKSLLFESMQNAQQAVKDLKSHPKLYTQFIDKFSSKHSKTDLELLFSGIANENDIENKQIIEFYIFNKIMKLDKEEKQKEESATYDLKNKRFVWKWRFTPWVISGISALIAGFSLWISILSYNKPPKQELDLKQMQRRQDSIQLESNRTVLRKVDSLLKTNPKGKH